MTKFSCEELWTKYHISMCPLQIFWLSERVPKTGYGGLLRQWPYAKDVSCSLLWVQDKNQVDLIYQDRSSTFVFLEKAETTIYSVVCTSSLKSVISYFVQHLKLWSLCMGRSHKNRWEWNFWKLPKSESSSKFVASRPEWYLPQWYFIKKSMTTICTKL